MKDKNELLKAMDTAIDEMDMDQIDSTLAMLSAVDTNPIAPEDAKLFSMRIQKQSKGSFHMQKSYKALKVAVCAAVIMLVGVTAYAAGVVNVFKIENSNNVTTIRTTEDMTEEDIRNMQMEINREAPNEHNTITPEYTFGSLEEAEKQLDIKMILPAKMPEDMVFESGEGTSYSDEDVKSAIAWLNYTGANDRMFGLTVSRTVIAASSKVSLVNVNEVDEGSISSYKSKSGLTYTMVKESDETGEKTANIANITIGEYDYALVFVGFEQSEYEAIIDSLDLSSLK